MINVAIAHDGPADTCELIGDGDNDDIAVCAPIRHLVDPGAHPMLAAVHVEVATSGPVDDELAQVGAATLADTEQPLFTAGGMLAWNQAQPRGKFPAALELLAITDGGNQGSGD